MYEFSGIIETTVHPLFLYLHMPAAYAARKAALEKLTTHVQYSKVDPQVFKSCK